MGRPNRADPPGAWHHTMNRGVDRQDIFRSDRDRRRFIRMLGEFAVDCHVGIGAYCLMGNHFHLLVHCPEGGISSFMQRLTGDYARWFNHVGGRDGHLFRGRFNSKLVDSDSYLAHLLTYIHANPAEIGENPLTWRWSSLGAYLGSVRPQPWLSIEGLLAHRGSREDHRNAVNSCGQELAQRSAAGRATVDIESLSAAIASTTPALSDSQHTAAVLLLGHELLGWSISQIASELNLTSIPAARMRLHRVRAKARNDPTFQRLFSTVARELSPGNRHAA